MMTKGIHRGLVIRLSLLPLFFLTAFSLYGQTPQIKGKITGDGGAVAGASVVNIQSGAAVQSDSDGNYAIQAVSGDILEFSALGYLDQLVTVGTGATLDVHLETSLETLDEVVVVGYGMQKAANLTGSVSSISSNDLSNNAQPNSANLLQGRAAGLEIIRPSGRPGNDNPAMRIRGMGSFGASSSPLVLIDGIIGSISTVAPSDIESITVLKDAASASIYGARAANGVILVTTKKGKLGTSLEYKLDVGLQNATAIRELIWNSAEYMEMYNAARVRSGLTPFYTQDQIDSYANSTDEELFPNFNWPDHYFKTATIYNHSLNFSKGTESSTFRLGLNYSNQDGILPVFGAKRYMANINYESRALDKVRVGAVVNFYHQETAEPQGNGELDISRAIYGRSPLARPFLPDGRKSSGRAYASEPFSTFAPLAFTNGSIQGQQYSIKAQAYIVVDILDNLQWETKGAVNYDSFFRKTHAYGTPGEYYFYQKLPGESDYTVDQSVGNPISLGVSDYFNKAILPTVYTTLNYRESVGAHHFGVLAGYEQQSNNYRELLGRRLAFPTPGLKELNAGSPAGQSLSGTANAWGLQSFFGRVNYNYKERYLLESNIRYDGTSRVEESNRWGVFPSVSGAWRISEESFIKDNVPNIDQIKLRVSYGLLGNQEIGLYPYQDIFGYANYSYGGSVQQGVRLSRMTDKSLQWEKTKIFDVGLDVDVFQGLLGLSFDWYRKYTYDILTTLPVPSSIGLTGAITNDGALENKGMELGLRHRNQLGELYYDATFQISGYRNELKSIVTPTLGTREVGLPYNSFYLYEWDGIFQSEQDIDNSPTQIFNNPKPGDLKIKDQNGDNVVDADDRISINPFPKYSYSLNLNLHWQQFSVGAFLQGVKGSKALLADWATFPFREGTPPKTEFRDAWTPENPSNTVPAIHEFSYSGVYGYTSTYLLRNTSYLRLKNVYVSYTLPESALKTVKLQGLTVYVSGNDLLTFTKFTDGDPEMREGAQIPQFPQVRIINLGLSVNF